jgi:hypothetical protein
LYWLKVSIVDANRRSLFWTSRPVVVGDIADMDAKLRGVYTGMLDRLRVGQIDAATTAITETLRERYRDAFTRLGSTLPKAIDGLGQVGDNAMSDEHAAITITRDKADGTYAYEVLMIRDGDGVWRIDGM